MIFFTTPIGPFHFKSKKNIYDVQKCKKKVYIDNSVIVCGKKSQNIYNVKKKTCFGCFRYEKIQDDGNETGWKEGGGTENQYYSAFHIRECIRTAFA